MYKIALASSAVEHPLTPAQPSTPFFSTRVLPHHVSALPSRPWHAQRYRLSAAVTKHEQSTPFPQKTHKRRTAIPAHGNRHHPARHEAVQLAGRANQPTLATAPGVRTNRASRDREVAYSVEAGRKTNRGSRGCSAAPGGGPCRRARRCIPSGATSRSGGPSGVPSPPETGPAGRPRCWPRARRPRSCTVPGCCKENIRRQRTTGQ